MCVCVCVYVRVLTASLVHPVNGDKVDQLLSCGDFQAVRNQHDLECMACPPKYRELKDFHEYYEGRRVAPVLTIFIGGNHEV